MTNFVWLDGINDDNYPIYSYDFMYPSYKDDNQQINTKPVIDQMISIIKAVDKSSTLKFLHLPDEINIIINFMYYYKGQATKSIDDRQYIIKFDALYKIANGDFDISEFIDTIFHEFRHIHQFYTKELSYKNSTGDMLWMGQTYNLINDPYDKLPWEIDANNFMNKMRRFHPMIKGLIQ